MIIRIRGFNLCWRYLKKSSWRNIWSIIRTGKSTFYWLGRGAVAYGYWNALSRELDKNNWSIKQDGRDYIIQKKNATLEDDKHVFRISLNNKPNCDSLPDFIPHI